MKKIALLVFVGCTLITPLASLAQMDNEITRASNQSMNLKRKLIKNFNLILEKFDHLTFETHTRKKINFRVISPSGAIVHEALIKKAKMTWQFDAIDSGNKFQRS